MQFRTTRKKEPKAKEIIIRDAITAGICRAFDLEVTAQYTPKEVVYSIRGNVEEVLKKIAANAPVGSRDVLESIKTCRSAIWLFKQGGHK